MTDPRSSVKGLYAVTPDTLDTQWLLERVDQALVGGARLLQYRSKMLERARKLHLAHELKARCRQRGALFIVNDDVELAGLCGADGVHLGQDDASIAEARARLGSARLIGASCYADLVRAQRCVEAGADYLAFGSFFASAVKPGAARASPHLLREARERWTVPLVAIGGITPDNAGPIVDAGAHALAVISALFHVPDTHAAALAFGRVFESRSRCASIGATA